MFDELKAAGKNVHLIGGAKEAGELDAKRAIRQGAELAAVILKILKTCLFPSPLIKGEG